MQTYVRRYVGTHIMHKHKYIDHIHTYIYSYIHADIRA